MLPEWTKACPFQIKGIAIKEAVNAFYNAKGQPTFRSRKNPVQSCFIPKTALKETGIYPTVSGKGLRYSESLPESVLDSRLVWKAGRYYLSVPFKAPRVPDGENQARVVVSKVGRSLRAKSVRSMLSFAHYRFKQFIKHKAFEYGKRVVDVNEAYTSKTHPETGQIMNIGGAKHIKLLSGKWVNRDLVGARNILLRALVDTPQSADWQLMINNVTVNNC